MRASIGWLQAGYSAARRIDGPDSQMLCGWCNITRSKPPTRAQCLNCKPAHFKQLLQLETEAFITPLFCPSNLVETVDYSRPVTRGS